MDNRITIKDPMAAKTNVTEIAVLWDRFAEIIESDLAEIAEIEPWITEAQMTLSRKQSELYEDLDAVRKMEDSDISRAMFAELNKKLEELNREIQAIKQIAEQYYICKADAARLIRDSAAVRDGEKNLVQHVVAALDYINDSK